MQKKILKKRNAAESWWGNLSGGTYLLGLKGGRIIQLMFINSENVNRGVIQSRQLTIQLFIQST
jgi:hypothetical protein